MVEVLGDGGEMEGCLAEDGGPVISQWLAINSTEQLDQFMVSQNFMQSSTCRSGNKLHYSCELDMESTITIRFLGTTHNQE